MYFMAYFIIIVPKIAYKTIQPENLGQLDLYALVLPSSFSRIGNSIRGNGGRGQYDVGDVCVG